MKAVVIRAFGDPEVMKVEEVAKPSPKSNELLVRVRASSVNPVDWKIRKGELKFLSGSRFPKIIGGDMAGEVAEVGSRVTGFSEGDSVYATTNAFRDGAYAQYVVAKSKLFGHAPETVDLKATATIPIAGLTSYQALKYEGNIKPGDKVLINGCSGGVGHFGIQLAKAWQAEVTGVCSEKNASFSKELGADKLLDYNKTDVLILEEKFNIFFDAAGKYTFSQVKHLLTDNGTYITTLPNFSAMFLAPILNSFRGKKEKKILVKSNTKDLDDFSSMVDDNMIKIHVEKVYQMEEIAAAHEHAEKGTRGKIALDFN